MIIWFLAVVFNGTAVIVGVPLLVVSPRLVSKETGGKPPVSSNQLSFYCRVRVPLINVTV